MWATEPVWTGAENLTPTEIRSPDIPTRSQSLYRQRYPAHLGLHCSYKFYYYVDPDIWQGDCLPFWRASECHSLTFLTVGGVRARPPHPPFHDSPLAFTKFPVYTNPPAPLSHSLSLYPRLITNFSFHTLIKHFNGKQTFVFVSSSCVIRLIF